MRDCWTRPLRRKLFLEAASVAPDAAGLPAAARNIAEAATKRKVERAEDLHFLNETFLIEAGATMPGCESKKSKVLPAISFGVVNRHFDLLLNGEILFTPMELGSARLSISRQRVEDKKNSFETRDCISTRIATMRQSAF